jgi:hypothetical protein
MIFLARLGGLEPPTRGLEVRCSVHLSYRRNMPLRCWGACVRITENGMANQVSTVEENHSNRVALWLNIPDVSSLSPRLST